MSVLTTFTFMFLQLCTIEHSFFKMALEMHLSLISVGIYYVSPTSGEAYRDRRLTTNFELWVEIFCVPTCFHVRIPKPCLSICPHPEKRYHHSFVNISPTFSNWYINGKVFRSSYYTMKTQKIEFFFQKTLKFVFWRRAEITLASSISVLY